MLHADVKQILVLGDPMNLELTGTGTHNAGAELMARAVGGWASAAGHRCCVAAHFGDFARRALCGFTTKLPMPVFSKSALFGRFAPSAFFRDYGITRENEIEAVLDASGFLYGDQWGNRGYEQLSHRSELCSRRGQRFVLLPQSLGPIHSERDRSFFKRACENIDLIFPRDRDSYSLLAELDVQTKFVQRPDFTVDVPGFVLPEDLRLRGSIIIVPNIRMTDKIGEQGSQAYRRLLAAITRYFIMQQFEIAFLVHSVGDESVVTDIAKLIARDLPVINICDPQRIKGVLGLARVVVGSRYHALVSALTQGVPCLGFGWSHKYRDLFSDFGFDPYLVDVDASEQVVLQLLAELLDQQRRAGTTRLLLKASKAYQEQTVSMWQETAKAIQPE